MSDVRNNFHRLKNIFILLHYNQKVLTFLDHETFIQREIYHQEMKIKLISSGFKSGLNRYFYLFFAKNRFFFIIDVQLEFLNKTLISAVIAQLKHNYVELEIRQKLKTKQFQKKNRFLH